MSQVAVLIEKLNAQIQSGEQVDSFIDALQMFVDHREDEEIVGLEDKLAYVGRSDEIKSALKKKELFQKKLMALEPFSSAQKIFAIFLSRIHEVFEAHIMHNGQALDRTSVECVVEEKIINPTIAEIDASVGSDHLLITHTLIKGMIFWLADRCWVRWH